jgi:hypothetical protein
MIITAERGGRNKRHGRYLIAHLAKTENVSAVIATIGNCCAETLAEFISTVEIYRDASHRATSHSSPAFHHLTVNPSKDHPTKKLIEAAHRVRRELDTAAGSPRPYAMILHTKPRAAPVGSKDGGSSRHLHLIIGAVDDKGAFLDDSWSKIKTERLALELGHDLSEPPVVGRHFQSALRVLKTTRPDVVKWLEDEVGIKPEKPTSAISSKSRARAKAQGLDLPKAKTAVRRAKIASSDAHSFQANLAEIGMSIEPGDKPSIWVIRDRKGRLIGSADRLLKIRRAEFHAYMEKTTNEPEARIDHRHQRSGSDRENERNDRVDVITGAGRDGLSRSDRPPAFRNRARTTDSARVDRVHQRKTRRLDRRWRIFRSLSRHYAKLLAALTSIAAHIWRQPHDHVSSDMELNPKQEISDFRRLPKPRS